MKRAVALVLVALVGATAWAFVGADRRTPARLEPAGDAPFDAHGWLPAGPISARWSPDGAHIAALSGVGVSLVRGGHLSPLTEPGERVATFGWMPGSNAVLVADGPGATTSLRVFALDGRSLGVVHPTPELALSGDDGLAVSPDGRRAVVVATIRPVLSARAVHQLVEVDLTSGSSRPLTDPSSVDATTPSILDDGRVVFAANAGGRTTVAVIAAAAGAVMSLGSGRPVGVGGFGAFVAVQRGRDLVAVALTEGSSVRTIARVPAGTDVVAVDPVAALAVVRDPLVVASGTPPVVRLRSIRLKS